MTNAGKEKVCIPFSFQVSIIEMEFETEEKNC